MENLSQHEFENSFILPSPESDFSDYIIPSATLLNSVPSQDPPNFSGTSQAVHSPDDPSGLLIADWRMKRHNADTTINVALQTLNSAYCALHVANDAAQRVIEMFDYQGKCPEHQTLVALQQRVAALEMKQPEQPPARKATKKKK
ncbi:hypothetical protein P152DRAFT_482191 [Eremomyces bilateralis CBS 781.70]|uniref:Uncharacterized protein n=1 Tax=Eremomyces bilateralis CBS 781.70 TaxID=1392243 RepID=A0A6G1G3Y6_9PEZI|nr:uncharacterized protein P152DRAFT_482191 [Eremomyces bilateralis CBS 781.70]KAF1812728.1 hypothetical protein P152DRAFT_482191 [Eremomyces bilateralis CBS 781.70]